MASNSTNTTSEASAAAEVPVLNGDGDDRRVHVPTKGTSTGKGKLKVGTKQGKGKDDASTYCANCGEEGDARCGGCGVVYYCRKNIVIKNGKEVNLCQQVQDALNDNINVHTHPLHLHLLTGALEVRRPQVRVQGLRARGRGPGAAG